MPPAFLFDVAGIDFHRVLYGREEIDRYLPQRFEFTQLDAIVHLDLEAGHIAGYRDIREDQFWVRGHIPGRPLFPGVLMIEASAQICSWFYQRSLEGYDRRFIGFGGVDGVKFRGTVVPGDRFVILAKRLELKPRRATFQTQGLVGDRLVYEGNIIGMPV